MCKRFNIKEINNATLTKNAQGNVKNNRLIGGEINYIYKIKYND